VKSFVKFLNTNKTVLFGEPIYISSSKQTIDSLEVAIQYNDGYNENINSFVNNVNTQEGGSHIAGFRSALTRSINNFIQTNSTQKNKENVSGDDIKEGLVAVLSIKVQNPQFEGQTKTKLGNSEIKGFVESILNEKLSEYFEINQNIAKTIINKAYETKKAREAAKKAKELVKSKNLIESGILPGKLADCQESNPDLCELFIVEGDSAGGSAKQGRDRKIQAILPLKGKILNVEKSSQEKVLSNNEIKSVYMAVGINSDNIERLRYKKIIIMTDADVDGSHIRTLLLTLFYRKTPEIIMNGHLYIAQPPLYKAKQGNKETYIKDEDEFESFVTKRGLERVECRVGGRQIDRGPLKEHTEKMRRIERFLKDISRSGVSRAIVLELFRLNIHKREDFEEIQKLYAFKENVGKVGYSVEMERDREYNLFKLILRHAEKKETTEIDYEVCTQEDYIERLKDYNDVKEFYEEEIVITDGNSKQETKTVEEFIKYINEHGKEGISIQRYKGLGEMNPEQLWETTMNPEKRSLLRVSIEDAIEADQMFTVLMGSNIETRRAFIEENAMNVRNLDI
ncbi:MAG TPA: toprim domain-containing protein, partial [Syntrophorhabdaceae bacterium]|nr:toprim domain-containing protein [Syntrophorhabdaceae bacterium]